MSFASYMPVVIQEVQIKDKDRAGYTNDAELIGNKIMKEMKAADAHFRKAFKGLSLTGSYLDRVKLTKPDEFDKHILLKFPFVVNAVKDEIRPGFVQLAVQAAVSHPAVVDGYVNRRVLQDWLRNAFQAALKNNTIIFFSLYNMEYKSYKLEYVQQGYDCAHTIIAKSELRTIAFDFVPAFAYQYKDWPLEEPPVDIGVREKWPWFAVPKGRAPRDDRTFMVCAPHWERRMMFLKYNLINVLRLMKTLREYHPEDMPRLQSYMLKTVLLLQLDNYNWQQDMGDLLIELWSKLKQHLQERSLPHFLAPDCNQFETFCDKDYEKCKETVERIAAQLAELKLQKPTKKTKAQYRADVLQAQLQQKEKVIQAFIMSLSSHLPDILNHISIKENERATYLNHAQLLVNELMEDLQKKDELFRQAFNGMSLTGSYLDRVKLISPDEFDMHIKLKFPFQVTPERDYQRSGFVFLKVNGYSSHPAVVNGYVNRKALQQWLRQAFQAVFSWYTQLRIAGEIYNLNYEFQGYGCAHTIVATSERRTISFDFVPAFEYTYNDWPLSAPPVSGQVRGSWPWFAVPQGKAPNDERTFMVCAPQWEREMMKDNYNLKNVLRLMKALRDNYKDEMQHLSSYMLKTVLLLELDKRTTQFWQQDMATILICMWSKLLVYLVGLNLPFFFSPGCNHFDRLKADEMAKI
ncbi:CG7194, partial [Drosophila busckii]